MSKLLLPTLTLFLGFWIFGGTWWLTDHYFSNNSSASNFSADSFFSVESQNLSFKAKANYRFKHSSAELIVPDKALEGIQAIVSYLNKQSSSSLELVGLYAPTETNPTQHKNLGIARAAAFKNKLITLGAPQTKIRLNSLKAVNIPFQKKVLFGGVLLTFDDEGKISSTVQTNDENRKNVWKIQPLNLVYNNQKKKLKLTPALAESFDAFKYLLQEEKTASIVITGHTDKVGSRKKNLKLSKSRAINVRDFMIENGFDSRRLIVQYKGPDEPYVSNDTEEGRKKNRRVEIRIK